MYHLLQGGNYAGYPSTEYLPISLILYSFENQYAYKIMLSFLKLPSFFFPNSMNQLLHIKDKVLFYFLLFHHNRQQKLNNLQREVPLKADK